MLQMTQKTQRGRGWKEPIFPRPAGFAVFLEAVARHALQCGASPSNVRRLVKFLRVRFGKGQGLQREALTNAR